MYSTLNMGRSKTAERQQGQDLFVNTNLTLKDIAAMINVSAAKVGQWAKADNWELQRTAKQNTAEKIINGWYAQLAAINKEVAENGGMPNGLQSDSMCKITGNIEKLSKKQNLSMYHTVLKEFLNDLMTIDTDAAKKFGPYMLDFMKNKATQLSNDK